MNTPPSCNANASWRMLMVDPQSLFADYGVDKYDIGTGFGHFGIGVDDVRLNQLEPCLKIGIILMIE